MALRDAEHKKVLFITYHYLPEGGVPVMRTVKFLKYLPRFGWRPSVLTLKTTEHLVTDETLAEQVPHDVKVYRVPKVGNLLADVSAKSRLELWFDFPDVESRWIPRAVPKGIRIIEKERIPMIYTTSPPHSTSVVGCLCKFVTGVSWVADFRDTWVGNCFFTPERGTKRWLHGKLEEMVVRSADLVLVNTRYAMNEFRDRYPELKDKFVWLPNGFDPEDFQGIEPVRPNKDRFTLMYVGSIGEGRPMDFFFRAIRELFDERPETRNEVEVVFVGGLSDTAQELICQLELEETVKWKGHLPHREAIRCMFESDVLLLFMFQRHGGSAMLPSKVFEYMRAGKPIFAQVCAGAAADTVGNYKGGYVADSEDVGQIKETLLKLYEMHKSGTLTVVEDQNIGNFSRVTLASRMHDLFNQALSRNPMVS